MSIKTIRANNEANNDTSANRWIRRGFFATFAVGAWLAAYNHPIGYVILGISGVYFLSMLALKIIKP